VFSNFKVSKLSPFSDFFEASSRKKKQIGRGARRSVRNEILQVSRSFNLEIVQ
jgi:hypothetical protein